MSAQNLAPALGQEVARQYFTGTRDRVYLNTAAEGLALRSHAEALARYAGCKARGSAGREECAETEARCRALAAGMLGARPQDVAFVASTARGLDAVIKSIDWQAGDNVVLADSEFPTAAFAATLLSRRGIERRVVRARDGQTPVSDFAGLIDGRTRLVLVSLVSYKTGYRMDIPALAEVTHAAGALLFVDAIQALGAVPVDCGPADFVCAGTYKWQLGCHGLAVLYASPEAADRIGVPYVGFRGVTDIFPADRRQSFELYADARRFEEGMPNYPAMFVLEDALTFLTSVGIARVASHNAELVTAAMSGFESLGLRPLTTTDRLARAGIASFETPLATEAARLLRDAGVEVWGKDGRVRVSAHLYNTSDDVAALVDALGKLISEGLRLQP